MKTTYESEETSLFERGDRTCLEPDISAQAVDDGVESCWLPDSTVAEGVDQPRRRRVLLAERDPDIRSVVHEMLAQLGMEVIPTSNGMRALEIWLAGESVDLILIGSLLRAWTGQELLFRIREKDPDFPIVFMSDNEFHAYLLPNPDDPNLLFLSVPFSVQSLRLTIQILLEVDC